MVSWEYLWPTLRCRREARVSPLLSIGWWYLSSVSPKRHCCRVSAADKGCRVYPLDSRPDAVALYSGCTPVTHTEKKRLFSALKSRFILDLNFSTSSYTTQANILPSATSIKPTSQIESRLPGPISASDATPDNSLNTSTSSLSTETCPAPTTSNKFVALQSSEPLLEAATTSNSELPNASKVPRNDCHGWFGCSPIWPSSFLKKYEPMIPPAHKAHQTETGSITRSSAPYLETTILLVLLAWLVGERVASLSQESMGWLVSAIRIEHCYWLWSKLAETALLREKI
ncbi:uncharacterized protein TNCV_2335431 [Trichonephila clavipes]|uniref:Uncharacterized protein n=1 Tax=Trichonephila clavipes TaxID=2585209 RepID=A0A8X6VHU5_TRICX|nr:uncharacterized protein TNCV_2335431 [Trichonephila clavipes]